MSFIVDDLHNFRSRLSIMGAELERHTKSVRETMEAFDELRKRFEHESDELYDLAGDVDNAIAEAYSDGESSVSLPSDTPMLHDLAAAACQFLQDYESRDSVDPVYLARLRELTREYIRTARPGNGLYIKP